MVLNYHLEGNLRNYLQKNHSNSTLKDRITMFHRIYGRLYDIHHEDLIHCDLHSGNIIMQGGGCFITDLGLCGPVDNELSNKIYGIISYIAPEVLRGNKHHTKESDVYSIGMLMWEIFSGYPPFNDRAHDCYLILEICKNDLRPPILSNMPKEYVEMMKKCWDVDPSKRPTIGELWNFAEDYSNNLYKNEPLNNKIITHITSNLNNKNKTIRKFTNFSRKFYKASNNKKLVITANDSNSSYSNNNNNNNDQIQKPHPLAYHSSRILENDIVKYKSLQQSLELGPVSEVISEMEVEGKLN